MKALLVFLFLALSCLGFAQVKYVYPVEFGVGYSRPQLKDWSHSGETTPEATFNMIEFYAFGLYGAISIPNKVESPEGGQITTNYYRVGVELGRIKWGDSWWTQSVAVTPFYSFARGFNEVNMPVGIKGNSWGLKVDYAFSILDVSLLASQQEVTLGIAIVFPFYATKGDKYF